MDLKEARTQIDGIDQKLTELFVERMQLAKEISDYKKQNKLPVYDKTREREVLNREEDRAGKEFESYIQVLYTTLFDVSRAYQRQMIGSHSPLKAKIEEAIASTDKLFPTRAVVACQGVAGSYSEAACDTVFTTPSIMFFKHFGGVFQAVEQGLCNYGVLPIENSTAGSVNEVYDLMKKHKFHIVRSVKLRISHHLLAKPGATLAGVKEIYSKDIALEQCSEFLAGLKDVKLHVCENTAEAARQVAESDRTDIAAIASPGCMELYGLTSLSDTIQNSDNNFTRFICISKNLEIYPGADKVSIMFSIPHKPGALYNVISRFSALGLNLTKLESRPIPGRDFEFLFYFDLNGNVADEKVLNLLCQFDDEFGQFTYLGSYSEVASA